MQPYSIYHSVEEKNHHSTNISYNLMVSNSEFVCQNTVFNDLYLRIWCKDMLMAVSEISQATGV